MQLDIAGYREYKMLPDQGGNKVRTGLKQFVGQHGLPENLLEGLDNVCASSFQIPSIVAEDNSAISVNTSGTNFQLLLSDIDYTW